MILYIAGKGNTAVKPLTCARGLILVFCTPISRKISKENTKLIWLGASSWSVSYFELYHNQHDGMVVFNFLGQPGSRNLKARRLAIAKVADAQKFNCCVT